ncbi:MAG TPA: bifunctional histidinol-phosphatase/imidazoleglycerol-phosphate dehydratase [Microscillaceae bacterium]|nr:bifunctional histidinol-phosphatase/imidazoleglycerol-phosphate dehydratase [Microscillaceae bacterium]
MQTPKKVLFIDRDGTIILEPQDNFQIDSLAKLEFYPKVIRNLHRLVHQLGYTLVMVTNQDGLGTPSLPEDDFWPPHQKMLTTLANEGIVFQEVLIDRSFEHENKPTRKPGIAMLTNYMNNPLYDLANSFVIGDRITDLQLAYRLGTKGILLGNQTQGDVFNILQEKEGLSASALSTLPEQFQCISMDWDVIFDYILQQTKLSRQAKIRRTTKETDILVDLTLNGSGKFNIRTGIGFFDHMLEQLAYHAKVDLLVETNGDLHIDEHHTIEDTAIALGQAFRQALGDKRGIERYGFYNLVMDDSLAQVALDFSGRPWLVWKAHFSREKIGQMPTEMFAHFFKSFSDQALCNLHIVCEGDNAHHQIEAIFKAFARSIKQAIQITSVDIQSTKGVI